MLPSWMSIPYLIAAFGGLLLSNHLSVYSAGLTMITLGIRVRRTLAVGLDVVVTFAGGIYFILIAKDFYGPFITFLTLLAVPITAWVGVFAVDLILRRSYDGAALMDARPLQPLLVPGRDRLGRDDRLGGGHRGGPAVHRGEHQRDRRVVLRAARPTAGSGPTGWGGW